VEDYGPVSAQYRIVSYFVHIHYHCPDFFKTNPLVLVSLVGSRQLNKTKDYNNFNFKYILH